MKRALLAALMMTMAHPSMTMGDSSDDPAITEEAPDQPVVEDSRVECIIQKESGGLDVYNRQGSGAAGPGQYFPGTWAAHVDLYRRATGYEDPLSLHSLADVERVMSFILSAYPWMRSAWTVSGC